MSILPSPDPWCYDDGMNTQQVIRIITGSLVIIIGLGALLDAVGVFPFWATLRTWWPLGVIIVGLLVLANNIRQFIWGGILIVGGILLQLRNLEIIDFNVWSLFWPAILIAVGVSILLNRSMTPKNAHSKDVDNLSAVFGGVETVNNSKNYKGGKASAIFGGVSLDLRDAKIDKEATIDVFALCGGVEIKVPREWKIQSHTFPILGGVETKNAGQKADDKSPILIITGTVALGGVEVKS